MSSPNGVWGEMVMPGVYMIQRTVTQERTQKVVDKDGKINLELIHLEMEELSRDISRLIESNEEIVHYLARKQDSEGSDEEDEEEDCCMAATLATASGKVEREDDDAIFHEALIENEGVIKRKEAELALLRSLVAGQKCGCHAHEAPANTEAVDVHDTATTQDEEAVPSNRIIL